MSEFDVLPRSERSLGFTTESCTGIIRRFLSRLMRVNWRKELRLRKNLWNVAESEVEIMVKFLKGIDSEFLKMLQLYSSTSLLRHPHSETLFRTACHEAGHVVSLWFTENPRMLSYVTIKPTRYCLGEVDYEDVYDDAYENVNNLFTDMCCFMGGGINSQLLSSKKYDTLHWLAQDISILSAKTYKLAKLTLDETGEKDIITLMRLYFIKCYDVTRRILLKHKFAAKQLTYALFVEKELNYHQVTEILGPRPQMEKSLYEEFVKNQLTCDIFKPALDFKPALPFTNTRWLDRDNLSSRDMPDLSTFEFKFLDDSSKDVNEFSSVEFQLPDDSSKDVHELSTVEFQFPDDSSKDVNKFSTVDFKFPADSSNDVHKLSTVEFKFSDSCPAGCS